MNKIILFLPALILLSTSYAGNDAGTFKSHLKPFVGLEGSYNKSAINGEIINNNAPNRNNQPWGGRAAVGTTITLSKNISFSNEVGWSYFGKTTISDPKRYINTNTINGVDLLLGLIYKWNKTALIAKTGGLVENQYITHSTFNYSVNGKQISASSTLKNTKIQLLPVFKIGGIYNINEHLGVSLAYMQTFGSKFIVKINGDGTINQNYRNPTTQAALLGLCYTI